MINPPELQNNDETQNDAHIESKHKCAAVLAHTWVAILKAKLENSIF